MNDTLRYKKGITIPIVTLFATGTLIASGLVAYFTGQITTNNRVGEVEGDVKVLQSQDTNIKERIDRLDEDINKRFDSLEKLILGRQKNG